jgi:hypothetical protein
VLLLTLATPKKTKRPFAAEVRFNVMAAANATKVVRIRRRGGKVVQGCDVYIGRRCTFGGWDLQQSKWHNPFTVEQCNGSAKVAVERYEAYIKNNPVLMASLGELRGKVLGCWCKDQPDNVCHGDVLVRLLQQQTQQ